jgi:hypothetical protein
VLSAAWCGVAGNETFVAFTTHSHRLVICDVREPTRALLTDTIVGGRGLSTVWPGACALGALLRVLTRAVCSEQPRRGHACDGV